MLLNRHPLSTKRVESVPSASSGPIDTVSMAADSPKKEKRSAVKIPTIDLSKKLELPDDQSSEWWDKEKEAFKDAVTPDTITGGKVSQVAVSPVPSRLCSKLSNRQHSS